MASSPTTWLLGHAICGPETIAHSCCRSRKEEDKSEDTSLSVTRSIQSLVWCSYRCGFPEISPSHYSSDAGWGCMYRSAQMMLANAIVRQCLGCQWDTSSEELLKIYHTIVGLFADNPSAPFSIHNLCHGAKKFHNKAIGEWVGPSSVMQVVNSLVQGKVLPALDQPIHVYLASDGVVYLDDLRKGCQAAIAEFNAERKKSNSGSELYSQSFCPTLVAIPSRLGLDGLNSVYFDAVQDTFAIPQSMGIIGGRPRASLYFVGCTGSSLYYLDPHTTQMYVAPEDFEKGLQSTYHTPSVLSTHVSTLDPSMAFCFLLRDEEDVKQFASSVLSSDSSTQGKQGLSSLFAVLEEKPDFQTASRFSSGGLECLDMDEFDKEVLEPENIVMIDDEEMVLM